MSNVLSAPWFYWALILGIGLPVALVILTELQQSLARRGSFLARPVGLLRTYIVPLGALLLGIVKTTNISVEATGVRIMSTVFGFIVLIYPVMLCWMVMAYHVALPGDLPANGGGGPGDDQAGS